VLNAMIAAADTPAIRPPGKIVRALPHADLIAVMRQYGHTC
jgi:hypothetical protein